MSERLLHLPPTQPAPDAPLDLHDAELTLLGVEDFGRRLRLSLLTSVDRGRYEQPVEVVIEGADYVFWHDDTEHEDVMPVFRGGPTKRAYAYGQIAEPEQGVDYTLRCGTMNLTVIRARRITTLATSGLRSPDPRLADHEAWTPLDVAFIRRHMPDPRRSPGYQRLQTLLIAPEARTIVAHFEVEQQEQPSWIARAKYAGASRLELSHIDGTARPGEVRGVRLGPHAGWDRLQLSASGTAATIAGTQWQRRAI